MVAQPNTWVQKAVACLPKRDLKIEEKCDDCGAVIADGAIRVWVGAQTFCQECGWKDSTEDDFWFDSIFNESKEQDRSHAPSFDYAYWEGA